MPNSESFCPLCKEYASPLFIKNLHQIFICSTCNYEFININNSLNHVNTVYSNNYFESGNSGYKNYLDNKKILIKSGEKYAEILDRFTKPGTLLDIGSAGGFLLKGFLNKGWKGLGIEPNQKMVEYAKKSLNLTVLNGTFEDYEPSQQYDVVSMIQVISHFYDLDKALNKADSSTKKGGYWLVETWNKNSLTAKLFGKSWHEYNPPSVVRWFSIDSLKNYIERFGYKCLLIKRSVKWIRSKEAKNIITYNTNYFNKRITKSINLIPDNFKFPYIGNDLFFAVFQKN